MTVTAKSLYATVAQLGLTRAQARRILPDWWSPEIEGSADGAGELALLLSRRLSLDAGALMRGVIQAKGAVQSVAFKHRVGASAESLRAVTYMASSLAQAIVSAMRTPYTPISDSLHLVHEEIRSAGHRSLGFDGLLQLCWSHGIPVIPLPNLPIGLRKMDGAALLVGNRPAIVLAKRKSSKAWLSFILAHEIGHITLGHLKPGSTIIDVSLQESSTYSAESGEDVDESSADEYALNILGGQPALEVTSKWSPTLSPVELAMKARVSGAELGLESGHLVLRHAFTTKRWVESVTALKFLSEDIDPQSALLKALVSNLDISAVAADLQDLIVQVTGWPNDGDE